jgi:hypothetical protein
MAAPLPTDSGGRLPANPLSTGKVIIAAFLMGLVSFGIVVLILGPGVRKNQPSVDPQLPIILGAVMGGMLVLACIFGLGVMSAVLLSQAKAAWDRRTTTEEGAMGVARIYLTRTILRGAMFEAPGLLGGVITLLTGSWIGLCGVVASILLLLGIFPTKAGMQKFFEAATQHQHPAK